MVVVESVCNSKDFESKAVKVVVVSASDCNWNDAWVNDNESITVVIDGIVIVRGIAVDIVGRTVVIEDIVSVIAIVEIKLNVSVVIAGMVIVSG